MKCGALFLYCASLFSVICGQGKYARIEESFTLFSFDGCPLLSGKNANYSNTLFSRLFYYKNIQSFFTQSLKGVCYATTELDRLPSSSHTHTHTHARTRTHTHAHTRAHAHTHARTHTIKSQLYNLVLPPLSPSPTAVTSQCKPDATTGCGRG